VFHQRDRTIRGHVFCSFPALALKKEPYRRIEAAGHEQRLPGRQNGRAFKHAAVDRIAQGQEFEMLVAHVPHRGDAGFEQPRCQLHPLGGQGAGIRYRHVIRGVFARIERKMDMTVDKARKQVLDAHVDDLVMAPGRPPARSVSMAEILPSAIARFTCLGVAPLPSVMVPA
jgi:hypothetical protein